MKWIGQDDDLGEGHWADNISQELLSSWTLKLYLNALSVSDPVTAIRIGLQEEWL